MKTIKPLASLGLSVVALTIAACSSEVDVEQTEVQQSQIAYSSIRGDNEDIFIMNSDGTNTRRLTEHEASDREPDWSPDGTLLFVSERDGTPEIYTMQPDGSELRRLTNNDVSERSPKWSPDGTKIAYFSQHGEKSAAFVINADGTGETVITSPERDHLSPAWSPDGQWIATESAEDDQGWVGEDTPRRNQIWVQRVDGTEGREITAMDAYNGYPAWSPDGTRIAFDSNVSGHDPMNNDFELHIVNADGTGLTKLTEGNQDTFADWSADGQFIAFCSNRSGTEQIYVVDVNTGEQRRLTNNDYDEYGPSWSPF